MKKIIILMSITLALIRGGGSDTIQVVGQPVPVLKQQGRFLMPTWSPDGKHIALTTWKYQGLYNYSLDSGRITELTDSPGVGYGYAWSPDGQYIAMRVSKFENKRRLNTIAVVNLQTGKSSLLSDFKTYLPGLPRWTQQGDQVYISGGDYFQMYPVTGIKAQVDERTVYIKRGKIFTRHFGSQRESRIPSPEGKILELAVSPDHTHIAYNVMGGPLVISDMDGNEIVTVGPGSHPDWSPVGDRLTYMITTDDGHQITASEIMVINRDGTNKVNITKTPGRIEMHPDWSPDGRWIIYDTLDEGEIWMQEVK